MQNTVGVKGGFSRLHMRHGIPCDTNGELENIKSYVKIFKVSDTELHTDSLLQILAQISLLIEMVS